MDPLEQQQTPSSFFSSPNILDRDSFMKQVKQKFRQEYWSGLPFPSPGDLPNPGIKPGSPALQADALQSEPPGKPNPADSLPQKPEYRMLDPAL